MLMVRVLVVVLPLPLPLLLGTNECHFQVGGDGKETG